MCPLWPAVTVACQGCTWLPGWLLCSLPCLLLVTQLRSMYHEWFQNPLVACVTGEPSTYQVSLLGP